MDEKTNQLGKLDKITAFTPVTLKPATEVRDNFSDTLKSVRRGGNSVVVLTNGKPVGVIVSFDRFISDQQIVNEPRISLRIAENSRRLIESIFSSINNVQDAETLTPDISESSFLRSNNRYETEKYDVVRSLTENGVDKENIFVTPYVSSGMALFLTRGSTQASMAKLDDIIEQRLLGEGDYDKLFVVADDFDEMNEATHALEPVNKYLKILTLIAKHPELNIILLVLQRNVSEDGSPHE